MYQRPGASDSEAVFNGSVLQRRTLWRCSADIASARDGGMSFDWSGKRPIEAMHFDILT
jgi:hypothetical protein